MDWIAEGNVSKTKNACHVELTFETLSFGYPHKERAICPDRI